MNSPASLQTSLIDRLIADYPLILFEPAQTFRWSSENNCVQYDPSAEYSDWMLLHEVGHMVNADRGYNSDMRLLEMEMKAWQQARKLALHYGVEIDEDYIQDCLDSYRHWQHKRSTCPTCGQTGVQLRSGAYHCINCRARWNVTTNRFCRVYRRTDS